MEVADEAELLLPMKTEIRIWTNASEISESGDHKRYKYLYIEKAFWSLAYLWLNNVAKLLLISPKVYFNRNFIW